MTNGATAHGGELPDLADDELYARSLGELIQLRNDFARSKWKRRLEGADSAARTEFADLRDRVQDRIRDLTNRALSDIAEDLRLNERDLLDGVQDSRDARIRFENIAKTFRAISGFLRIVERILRL